MMTKTFGTVRASFWWLFSDDDGLFLNNNNHKEDCLFSNFHIVTYDKDFWTFEELLAFFGKCMFNVAVKHFFRWFEFSLLKLNIFFHLIETVI